MKHPNPPLPLASNSVTKTIVLSLTMRGPPGCVGLKELRPWLTDTLHDADGVPPFLPMPKNAFALELWKVYLPGPNPPTANHAAAMTSEPQKTMDRTIARRRKFIACGLRSVTGSAQSVPATTSKPKILKSPNGLAAR